MRLLNWNICIKLDNTSEVINFVEEQNVDICTFQEAMNGIEEKVFYMYKSKNELIKLKEYPFNEFAPLFIADGITKHGIKTRDFGGKAEQGALLLSKYEIKEHYNQFYYNNYMKCFDATYFKEKEWCRSIQNAVVNINRKSIQIINVHALWNKDKIGDDRTIMQSNFILSKIRTDIPCIVVGDFNLLPNSQSIEMIDEKMINLIKEYNIKSTRPTFDDGLDKGDHVCDYIFVNDKIKVNDFKVINNNISDHLPLILDFDII